ncbi:MAG: ABC transporter permease [Myxococcales bacterium]|nr:ABC transporter permease [Myxococcales bacterium]
MSWGSFVRSADEMLTLILALVTGALGGRFDARETWQQLYLVGVRSLPIVIVTAIFAGGISAIQVSAHVVRFQAYDAVGWGFGFVVFRELGPLLIGLMFSGRVGAFNAAELGTMKVTEQLDALRVLAINPLNYLVGPRIVAMVVMMTALVMVGNVFALLGGMLTAQVLVDVDPMVFWISLTDYVRPVDLFNGLVKAGLFGFVIGLVSCRHGLAVDGGAPGVGRAVNQAVVASALGIFCFDYLVTAILP